MGQRFSSLFREGPVRDALHTLWLWFFKVIDDEGRMFAERSGLFVGGCTTAFAGLVSCEYFGIYSIIISCIGASVALLAFVGFAISAAHWWGWMGQERVQSLEYDEHALPLADFGRFVTGERASPRRLSLIREENIRCETQAGSDIPLRTPQHRVPDVAGEDSGFSTEVPVETETSRIQRFKKAIFALSTSRRVRTSSESSRSSQSTETHDSSKKAKSPGKKGKSPKGKSRISPSKETKSSESPPRGRSKSPFSSPLQNKLKRLWEQFTWCLFKEARKEGLLLFPTDSYEHMDDSDVKESDKGEMTGIITRVFEHFLNKREAFPSSSPVKDLEMPSTSYQVRSRGAASTSGETSRWAETVFSEGVADTLTEDTTTPSLQSTARTLFERVRRSSAVDTRSEETSSPRKRPLVIVTDVSEESSPLKRTKSEQLLPESAVDPESQKALLSPAESTRTIETSLSEESEQCVSTASGTDDGSKDDSTPMESEDSRRSSENGP